MSTQPLRITLAGREHVVEGGTTAGAALVEAVQDPLRYRDGSHRNGIPIGDAVAEIVTAVRDRVQV